MGILNTAVTCHADGDRCHGCAHYWGRADECEFKTETSHLVPDTSDWESLKSLVVPQGPTPREATPDDIRNAFNSLQQHAWDANETRNVVEREKARICRAIGRYARLAPLDLKSPKEIQSDLFAICGEKHEHVASIGSDECHLCGHDLRHSVHVRDAEDQS